VSPLAQINDPCSSPEALIDSQATGPVFRLHLLRHMNFYMRAIDPEFATTYRCENMVNAVWPAPGRRRHFLTLVEEQDPEPLVFREVLADLREKIDLPISDLARLIGVERRHFYNLLNGAAVSLSREIFARALHQKVLRISTLTHGDAAKVRGALLLPLTPNGDTLYSVACTQNEAEMRRMADDLIQRLANGRVRGMISRPSPSLRRFSDGGHAADFLRGQSSEAETDP
jgi:hypothetical protein